MVKVMLVRRPLTCCVWNSEIRHLTGRATVVPWRLPESRSSVLAWEPHHCRVDLAGSLLELVEKAGCCPSSLMGCCVFHAQDAGTRGSALVLGLGFPVRMVQQKGGLGPSRLRDSWRRIVHDQHSSHTKSTCTES